MGALRRLLFVVGVFPVMVYAFARWVATGKDAATPILGFAAWAGVQ